MSPDQISKLSDGHDIETLRSVPDAEISAFLLSTVEAAESEAPLNVDRLMSLGVTLAKAGHETSDGPVLRWLNSAPTVRRVDVVAAFLNGLWKAPFRTMPVPPESVSLFLQGFRRAPLDDNAAYGGVLALSEAMTPFASKDVKATIGEALRAAAQRKYESPVAARMSQSVIEKALHRAGFDQNGK